MSAESYTELFRKNRYLVEKESCGVMNALRENALCCLDRYGLPDTSHEEYLHTNVCDWFEPDWGMNLGGVPINVNLNGGFRCSVPNMSSSVYYMANDRFAEVGMSLAENGVLAGSLKDICIKYPELISKYYGKLADMQKCGVASVNTLFAQDGFVIYVPDDVVVEKPVQLISLLQSPVDMMVTRRVLVILGNNSGLKLLLCDHTSDSRKYLTTQVTEIYAGAGSSLKFYEMEETSLSNSRVAELYIRQERDSNVSVTGITLNNGNTRNSSFVTLAGGGASLRLDGIAIVDGKQHIDNATFVDHQVENCQSSELFKYVLDDESVGAFSGKVLVREGAQHTVSQQTNRNICVKRTARMFTQPQLEIYADDVKCSHGATVGQIDEKALFYMRQRGIPEDEARTLLMMAFVEDVLDNIGLEPLRQRLRHLVERRFKSGSSLCSGCKICK